MDCCTAAGLLGVNRPGNAWRTWVARTLPGDTEAGGGLMVAIKLSIAPGFTLGGLAFDHSGEQSTFSISEILLVIAAILALLTPDKDIRHLIRKFILLSGC